MPNISLRKETGKRDKGLGTSRKKKHRRRRNPRNPRKDGLSHKDQRSLALHGVDELDNVRDMLDAAPMFNALALLVREVQQDPPIAAEKRDEIARFAKKHFDFDVDQLTEQPYQMNMLNELPGALTAAASWRLERLRRVLQWGLGT